MQRLSSRKRHYRDPPLPYYSMDSVFYLKGDALSRFLRSTARVIGCTYICLWSYIPHPSNCLVSMEGWYNEEDNSRVSSSSSGSILPQSLFDAYRRSLCSVESGCVPGIAYKEGHAFYELEVPQLFSLAAMPEQRQFYQEAGIKTAIFMGCSNGEIELGMSAQTNINMPVDVRSFFTKDYVQQYTQKGELFLADQNSSSSSSLRSFSVGSPEYSSLFLSQGNTSFMPADALKETIAEQAITPQITPTLVPPHQMTVQAYSRFRHNAIDDAAMTRAMLAILSSSSCSSSAVNNLASLPQTHSGHPYQASRRVLGAFRPYSSALAPKVEPKPSLYGQRMLKMAISIMREIESVRAESGHTREARPTANQLHHMISERKRREKLNESFHALRSLLPPGTKRDKASLLASTKDYINTLKAQISVFEEKNRILELTHLLPAADVSGEEALGISSERVNIQIVRAPESTSSMQHIELRISVRVECDMIELVLHILECLKEIRGMKLISMEANTYTKQMNSFRRATLTLQIQGSEWDEGSFKEAMARAVDEVANPATTKP